jgi:GDSL-like lipase/acylhydrolase family protein
MKRWLAYCTVALSLFGSGVAVGHYELAYAALRLLKATLFPQERAFDPRKHRSPYYLSRRAMFQGLPGRADVIMLGDSITEIGDWQELLPTISIINRGIWGDTSDGVLDRLDEITRRQPKTVFLMIGVNDLGLGISPQIVEQNIQSIVSALSSSGIKSIVQSTLFVSENPEINAKIQSLNDALRQWCANSGSPYIDLNPVLAPEGKLLPRYTWDGTHPNGDAYFQWRDVIAPHAGHGSF